MCEAILEPSQPGRALAVAAAAVAAAAVAAVVVASWLSKGVSDFDQAQLNVGWSQSYMYKLDVYTRACVLVHTGGGFESKGVRNRLRASH